jgi:hypothetical protein
VRLVRSSEGFFRQQQQKQLATKDGDNEDAAIDGGQKNGPDVAVEALAARRNAEPGHLQDVVGAATTSFGNADDEDDAATVTEPGTGPKVAGSRNEEEPAARRMWTKKGRVTRRESTKFLLLLLL